MAPVYITQRETERIRFVCHNIMSQAAKPHEYSASLTELGWAVVGMEVGWFVGGVVGFAVGSAVCSQK